VGLLQKSECFARIGFRQEGRRIIVLGGVLTIREDPLISFGSSQYAQTVLGTSWGIPPWVDLEYEGRVQACCRHLIAEALADSAHDLSDGGLAVALAESCMAGGQGATIDLNWNGDPRLLLFAEDPSRILMSVAEKDLSKVDRVVSEYNIKAVVLGTTGGAAISLSHQGEALFKIPVSALRSRYETALEQALEAASD